MSRYNILWETASKIPKGKVATYGQIAELAGMDGHARLAGYAMHALPKGTSVPWHRVLSSTGRISLPGAGGRKQRALLESEGVHFLPSGKVDFKKHRWNGGKDVTKLASQPTEDRG